MSELLLTRKELQGLILVIFTDVKNRSGLLTGQIFFFLWLGCICCTVLLEVAKLKFDLKADFSKMSASFLSSNILFVCLCNKSLNI